MATQYSYAALADWCRVLGKSLQAGLSWEKSLAMLVRSGPPELRLVSEEIQNDLKMGKSFHDSLIFRAPELPPMLHGLVQAGEQSGRLDQVLTQLADYYSRIRDMRRRTLTRLARPGIQMVGAIFVVVVAMIVSGLMTPPENNQVNVFGASGIFGALLVLSLVISVILIAIGAWFILRKNASSAALTKKLMSIPILGSVITNRTMWNFTTALHYSADSTMNVEEMVVLSFESTGNSYFKSFQDSCLRLVKQGKTLQQALGKNPVFSDRFLGMLTIGETTGQVSESMGREARYYEEQFEESLKRLSNAIIWGVYGFSGLIIIVLIFRFAMIYINAIGG
ncbi:MAG: type II secretion system F family protein [Zavarzinella sp.]